MSYFIIAQYTWHGLIGPFYVPSPLDGPPIHISSLSHVLDPSCYYGLDKKDDEKDGSSAGVPYVGWNWAFMFGLIFHFHFCL